MKSFQIKSSYFAKNRHYRDYDDFYEKVLRKYKRSFYENASVEVEHRERHGTFYFKYAFSLWKSKDREEEEERKRPVTRPAHTSIPPHRPVPSGAAVTTAGCWLWGLEHYGARNAFVLPALRAVWPDQWMQSHGSPV